MKNVLTLVLGGGRGTRLAPLTKYRAKPAVPLCGKYRLIDVPLSNCVHSGISQIYVLTQFLSVSLHRHIRQTYRFDGLRGGYVELLAAQQSDHQGTDWYQGTADAVRKNMQYLVDSNVDYVLILSGDQLYRMDYRALVKSHEAANADVTIAGLPVSREQASELGIMRLNEACRIEGFVEKPQSDEELEPVLMNPEWFTKNGIESGDRELIANMGIYLFNRQLLVDILEQTDAQDFGKEIFPNLVKTHHAHTFLFDGYWEDIGTIKAFFDANLAVAREHAPFQLAAESGPILTRPRYLPPARVRSAAISDSLLSEGSTIGEGSVIDGSIIGIRCQVGQHVEIHNSIVFGDDDHGTRADERAGREGAVSIGAGTKIKNTIVEKNVQIGENVSLVNKKGIQESGDIPLCMVRDGITVVLKDTHLPDNWSLEEHLNQYASN